MFSRIGASCVRIDNKCKVIVGDGILHVTFGSKVYDYQLDRKLLCEVESDGSSLNFKPNMDRIRSKACERKLRKIAGFHVRDLQNLFQGLVTPFKSNIEIVGTGYKVNYNKQSNLLTFSLGYSHDIGIVVPLDIAIEINQSKITLSSYSKLILGDFASYLTLGLRKFDKFKGKGVILTGKFMQRKELKKK